jgi:ATPase subunit of ABC transporter with duplicated ATPase domains
LPHLTPALQATWDRPHLILLDEPTNHLDMGEPVACDISNVSRNFRRTGTLDSLSSAVAEFGGAIVLVSHNRGFIASFCKELWLVVNNRVHVRHTDIDGSFDNAFEEYTSMVL